MHYLTKKFVEESYKNKKLYVKGIINNDKKTFDCFLKKISNYLYRIHFTSYASKCIDLKSKEIKREKNKLTDRETLSLNTYDEDFKEERVDKIPDKIIDFAEKISKPKKLNFTLVFQDKKLANTMNSLTNRKKQIMFLKYIKKYNEHQIACMLNVSPQSINKVKNSALKRVRK